VRHRAPTTGFEPRSVPCSGRGDAQRDQLPQLDCLIERLAEFFELEDAQLWLIAPHPQLHGERPVDSVAKGRQRDVLAVIARLQDSGFV